MSVETSKPYTDLHRELIGVLNQIGEITGNPPFDTTLIDQLENRQHEILAAMRKLKAKAAAYDKPKRG